MSNKLLKLRIGVADDPTALQPSLNDCLEAMLQQTEPLMHDVIQALMLGTAPGSRRIAGFQQPLIKASVEQLMRDSKAVTATFKTELTRLVFEGGGKEQVQSEALRFEDLQLFEDAQLDQSIETARAQQEVSNAVDDSLPALDALISTMLGWRTIQPGLNPLRPDVYVRALQHCLLTHVPEAVVREALIAPAAGLLGVNLRKLYRDLAEWLRSTGVEPAVPIGGRIHKGTGASGAPVIDSVAKTLLTLDRLRKLLAGDFDQPRKADFLHTVPASMALLQDLKQADALIKRLEQRPKPTPAPEPKDMLADTAAPAAGATARIGQQLGEEVVRLMFDNLSQDGRLLPTFKRKLKEMEPAVLRLTQEDSRFFSDRNHPARQMLDRITQRSLAYSAEQDPGWQKFLKSVDHATKWLESKVVDAETFGELLDHLDEEWSGQDEGLKQRREEAARALLHAEQRNLLAQRLAAEFTQAMEGLDVAEFIGDFLRNSWAQVVAEAQLSCTDGSSDPFGYRALVDDLIWSVQKTSAQRGRARRLVQMIPALLQRLREGLARIGYPPELTQRFFDNLITLHRAAVQEGRDAAAQAAADAAWEEESQFGDGAQDEVQMWLDKTEAQDSGFVPEDEINLDFVASPLAARQEAEAQDRRTAEAEVHRAEQAARAAEAQRVEEAEAARRATAEADRAAEEAARAAEQARAAAEAQQAAQARKTEAAKRAAAEAQQAAIEAERAAAAAKAEAEAKRAAEVQRAAEAKKAADEAEERRARLRRMAADAVAAGEAAQKSAASEVAQANRDKASQELDRREALRKMAADAVAAGEAAAKGPSTKPPAPPAAPAPELRMGSWVEILIKEEWVRAQLTWCSPHETLFMFTSAAGNAHSMSRRTLDKLRTAGQLKVVADRPVIDEALDQVAQQALKNSLEKKQ